MTSQGTFVSKSLEILTEKYIPMDQTYYAFDCMMMYAWLTSWLNGFNVGLGLCSGLLPTVRKLLLRLLETWHHTTLILLEGDG